MMQHDVIQTIFADSPYRLGLFGHSEIMALCDKVFAKTVRGKETPHVKCFVRDKDVQLKPEEVVRQLYATRLITRYGYPKNRLKFEHPVNFGREKKRADMALHKKCWLHKKSGCCTKSRSVFDDFQGLREGGYRRRKVF